MNIFLLEGGASLVVSIFLLFLKIILRLLFRFQQPLGLHLSQMVIFRFYQPCILFLFLGCKIRNRWTVDQAFMLFLFTHLWAQLLDFHPMLWSLLPTTYPRKYVNVLHWNSFHSDIMSLPINFVLLKIKHKYDNRNFLRLYSRILLLIILILLPWLNGCHQK